MPTLGQPRPHLLCSYPPILAFQTVRICIATIRIYFSGSNKDTRTWSQVAYE
jgi:hypothetical protein